MSKFTAPSRISPAASVSTTGAVTLLTLFAAAETRGQIVTNTFLNLPPITIGLSKDSSADWNIDGDGEGIAEVQFGATSYNFKLYLKHVSNSFGFVGAADGINLGKLAALSSPETVSAGRAFFSAADIASEGAFQDAVGFSSGQEGYFGFRFKPAAAGDFLYGWASVTITPEGDGSFTVGEWAYDASGASIQVGQTSAIPEPAGVAAGLGALALGAAGLRRWRKQKAA